MQWRQGGNVCSQLIHRRLEGKLDCQASRTWFRTRGRTLSGSWSPDSGSDWAAAGACVLSAEAGPGTQTWTCCGWRACSWGLRASGLTRRSRGWGRRHCRFAVPGPGPAACRWGPGRTGLWRKLWGGPSPSFSDLWAAPSSGTAHTSCLHRATPDGRTEC